MNVKTRPALLLFSGGMFLIHLLFFWSVRDLIAKGYGDFTIFYTAGKIVRSNLGNQLYDNSTQYKFQQEFASGVRIRQGPLPYNHPPFEALIFVPFSYCSYITSYVLWTLLNLLLLIALPFLLRPYVPLLQCAPVAFWLFVSLAFFGVFIALLQGQDVILLLLLLTLAFVALKKNAEFAAGCWLGLGLFRFHLVLPLVLVLLLHKRRKAVLGFALVALGLGLISIAVIGWKGAATYPLYIWNAENALEHGSTIVSDMPNLRGLVDSIGTARISKGVANGIVAVASIALVLLASFKWNLASTGMVFDLGFSLCLVVTVLVSYHALAHDLSLLLLPVYLLANHFRITEPRGWTRLAVLGPIVVLFFSPLQMVLWFREGEFNLLALVLLVWVCGIAREISDQEVISPKNTAALDSVQR